MSNKQITRLYWGAFSVGVIVIGGSIVQALLSNPGAELLPAYALAELYVSALAFLAVWLTLTFIIIQLRKSMAKPLVKVAFNEKGEQQTTLIYRKDGKLEAGLPHPWLINEGNAVARCFQIDFIIPENIGKQSQYIDITRDDGNYIVSNINDGQYTLFVNKPRSDPNMHFSSAMKLSKFNVARFKIKYKVYGDWAEIQEGELTIKCSKRRK
ncbi:MAG: hypothetical protein A2Z76_03420 [Chloroflexi bacterium RBG_13_56_8b]|nr:MAG: hypothetical protein A2Z76_03420 [Chloroflexi bacterium RBG_13_56_8b]